MSSAYCKVCFAVLLAVFCHSQALVPSNHNSTLSSRRFDNETRCCWNCTVIESDPTDEMKITIARGKLIQLVVEYVNKVDDKCVNQTSRNLSGNATELWQIWLANQQLSTFAKVMKSLENLMFVTDSNEERKEIRATCILKPATSITIRPTYYCGSSPISVGGHLADHLGVQFDSIDCNTKEKDDEQPCLNISKSAGNSTTTTESPASKGDGQPVDFLLDLCAVFFVVFIYYSPAFLCLFSPTEVTEDGVRQMVLEGASPFSFRNLIGNYFFSRNDTSWHRARMFFLRAVVIPLLFLGPALFADFYIQLFSIFSIFGVSHLFQPNMLVCYGCYYILTFYISFFTTRSSKPNRRCPVCKLVQSKTLICHEVLPKRIVNHLRLQPLIVMKCWKAFTRCLLTLFKVSFLVLPSACKCSTLFFLRLSVFVIFMFAIPAVTVTLLTAMLLVVGLSIAGTSPIIILGGRPKPLNAYSSNRVIQLLLLFAFIMVAIPALFGALFVLVLAANGVLLAIVLVFVLLLSEESLPYVACIVLVLYYMWSSYSSFTNKYQDLALALFKHYKKSRQYKCESMALNTNHGQENTSIADESKDNVMKIPKELFHMACEKLMPVRESVCILFLKLTIIVSFVLLVFSITMLLNVLNVGATPVMKALLTFLTGSFPKIVAIYIDGGRQKKIEAMVTKENIPTIVQEYISGTATETSVSNQGLDHRSADGEEVSLLNVDQEKVELVTV